MRSVFIATPTLDHRVTVEYMRCAAESAELLREHGIGTAFRWVGGDQFIAKARNRLVAEYLTEFPDTEALFFIDDDVGWPAVKVLEFMQRPEDVVCGVYPKKTEPPEWPATMEAGPDGRSFVSSGDLLAAIMAPAGFMRIRRPVLELLWNAATPYREMTAEGVFAERRAIFEAGINRQVDPAEFWGEDAVFCQLCRNAGFPVWIDPAIAFTHRGNRVYRGTFADAVAAKAAELQGDRNGEESSAPARYRPGDRHAA